MLQLLVPIMPILVNDFMFLKKIELFLYIP